jgi:hypothetical protein
MNETENKKPDADKHQIYRKLTNALTEAGTAQTLLECLRSGLIAEALEILESQLDTSILNINRFIDKVEPAAHIRAVETLRRIGQYRLQHPRKTEAKLSEEESEDDDSARQWVREKVRKILEETLAAPSPMEKEINDVKAAFATLVEYQQTDDIRVLDLFSPDCPITVTEGNTQETLTWPQDDFREWLRQQIALKLETKNTYEDVEYLYFGPDVSVTAVIHYANSGKRGPFSAVYRRDSNGIFKINQVDVTVFEDENLK